MAPLYEPCHLASRWNLHLKFVVKFFAKDRLVVCKRLSERKVKVFIQVFNRNSLADSFWYKFKANYCSNQTIVVKWKMAGNSFCEQMWLLQNFCDKIPALLIQTKINSLLRNFLLFSLSNISFILCCLKRCKISVLHKRDQSGDL